jgi:MYXO-CTERM domain-containing protein
MVSKVIFSAVLFVAGATGAWAQSQPTGSWSAEQGAYNFYYGTMVSDGTYFYIIGGYQYGSVVNGVTITSYPAVVAQMRRYDPANNTWTAMPQIAAGTANGSALWGHYYTQGAYYDGRILLFGGLVYTGTVGSASYSSAYSNAIRAFTYSTQTWTTLSATINGTRYGATANVVPTAAGDRIYITAGYDASFGYSYAHDEFNPSNDTVTSRAALPNNQGLYFHASAYLGSTEKLYLFGGLLNGAQSALVYEYTTPTAAVAGGSWTSLSPMSVGGAQQTRYYHKAVALNGRAYLFGGYLNGSISNQTTEYNALTNTWTQRANMGTTRYLHGAADINNKGYVYGGGSSPTTGEEYTPPSFGSAPNEPTAIAQTGSRAETSNQSLPDQTQFDGWTNNQIQFSANVTDPDAAQQVRFRVQVKPQNAQWTQANQVTSLATPLGAQGVHTLTYNIPADGGYDWRWRVEDAYANSHPLPSNGWVDAFGTFAAQNTNSPDFRSDQLPPSDPIAVAPHNVDTQVSDPVFGDVTLNWIESTDNGPVAGISYELQVATDGGFNGIEAQIFSTAGQSSYPITLTVSRFDKYWRIRARDVGGNFSSWSSPLNFRVTYNDGDDHGAGDAKKACGMSVGSVPMLGTAALGLLALGAAFLRRRR